MFVRKLFRLSVRFRSNAFAANDFAASALCRLCTAAAILVELSWDRRLLLSSSRLLSLAGMSKDLTSSAGMMLVGDLG